MKAWTYLLLFTALGASAGSIEAEAGRIAPGKAKLETYDGASGGRIVRLVGTPAMKPEEADRELSLTLPFTTERNGDFELVAYVCTGNGADDSAFFRVDDGKLRLFSAGHPQKAAPVTLGTFKLAAGKHTLNFHRREPGFGIDRLEVRPVVVNAAVARDRWTGSLFLTSRGRPAKTLWTTAAGGSAADWRELVENGTYRFEANGVFVGTAGFRRAEVMDGVRIRFRQGDVRRARFRIDVSPDGKTFAAVFDGMSFGTADGFETFAFPAQPVRAVRFTFSGNTQNQWNTIDGIGFRIVPTGK